MLEPIDHRKHTWADVRRRATERCLRVHAVLQERGPCTTRELARRSGMDILSVRPRVTDLFHLGLVVLADEDAPGREGIYRALTMDEAEARFARRRAEAVGTRVQAELSLH